MCSVLVLEIVLWVSEVFSVVVLSLHFSHIAVRCVGLGAQVGRLLAVKQVYHCEKGSKCVIAMSNLCPRDPSNNLPQKA